MLVVINAITADAIKVARAVALVFISISSFFSMVTIAVTGANGFQSRIRTRITD